MRSMAKSAKQKRLVSDILVNGLLFLLVALWTVPTLGVF